MQYGWEDENHEWKFIGNFSTYDFIHRITWPLALYKCHICDGYKTGPVESDKGNYETPECLSENRLTNRSPWDATPGEVLGGR